MCGDRPDGEGHPGATEGVGPQVVHDVRDAQQGQEEQQGLQRLSEIIEKQKNEIAANLMLRN